MIDYTKFPGLAGVYLEDSYVLAISDTPGRLTFKLDAVLTPANPAYHPPKPGDQYCYALGDLVFPDVTHVEWVRRSHTRYTDAAGEEDLGNIDILRTEGDAFLAEGDWGEVRVYGGPPLFVLA